MIEEDQGFLVLHPLWNITRVLAISLNISDSHSHVLGHDWSVFQNVEITVDRKLHRDVFAHEGTGCAASGADKGGLLLDFPAPLHLELVDRDVVVDLVKNEKI